MERGLFSPDNRIFFYYWFFPAPTRNDRGEILPAPFEVIKKRDELKENWQRENGHPQEIRFVSLSPIITENQTGYMVKVETFIRGAKNN
jgi:hypothetical protein